MDNTKELTHISLCTGYGGIDIGLSRALGAVRSVAYVEIEAFPIINLVKKIEAGLMDSAPIFTDLKEFPWGLYRGKVDILSGGFPCQPFSAAGRRSGDEDPRHLWPFIVRGIRELGRPPLVFFENVEGIISSKLKGDSWRDPEGTSVLLHVLRELERLGYKATAGVFSAAEVGAPHQRKRVFILGVRDDLRESGYDFISRRLRGGEPVEYSNNSTNNTSQYDTDFNRKTALQGWKKLSQLKHYRSGAAYPKGKGESQYFWEPPRVTMGDSNSSTTTKIQRRDSRIFSKSVKQKKADWSPGANHTFRSRGEVEPSMGRDIDGPADWLDYAELSESCDSRIDELRMLGNGVVPDTANRAFRTLFARLA